jgi:hypothetical protein
MGPSRNMDSSFRWNDELRLSGTGQFRPQANAKKPECRPACFLRRMARKLHDFVQ